MRKVSDGERAREKEYVTQRESKEIGIRHWEKEREIKEYDTQRERKEETNSTHNERKSE